MRRIIKPRALNELHSETNSILADVANVLQKTEEGLATLFILSELFSCAAWEENSSGFGQVFLLVGSPCAND